MEIPDTAEPAAVAPQLSADGGKKRKRRRH